MAGSPASLMGLHADPKRVGQADAHATAPSLMGPDPAGLRDKKIKKTHTGYVRLVVGASFGIIRGRVWPSSNVRIAENGRELQGLDLSMAGGPDVCMVRRWCL
jgi:hypothetical protein